ncbi:hypothetical protein BJX99DRAFT_262594 [Aspergillus californicus]
MIPSIPLPEHPNPLPVANTTCLAILLLYIVYVRFLHPLARYPGPLLASPSNTRKAYYVYTLTIHENLSSFTCRESKAPIYKGGRSMGKTGFYNVFLYVLDILGEVAFGKPFSVQGQGDLEELHAINDHFLLAGVIGELPLQNVTEMMSRLSPVPWMRQLMKSRNKRKDICAQCVRFKINNTSDIPDLLKSLVGAVDPESGSRFSE